jgi:hypothetical protein
VDQVRELRGAIEERLVVQRLWSSLILVLRAVAGHAGQAHLHAHIAKSLCHQLPCVVHNLFELSATGVRVGIGGFAALAAGQLVDGHAGLAAL